MSEIWGAHTCWSAQDSSALDTQDKTTLQVCKQRLQVWRMTLEDEIAGLEDDTAQDNSALAKARSVRDKENEELAALEANSNENVDPLAAGKEGELTTKIAGLEVDNAQDNVQADLSFGEFLRKD